MVGGVLGSDAVCVVSSAVALAFLQVVEPSAAQGTAGVVLYVSQVSLSAGRDLLEPRLWAEHRQGITSQHWIDITVVRVNC